MNICSVFLCVCACVSVSQTYLLGVNKLSVCELIIYSFTDYDLLIND